jgi:hypothetical protein
VQLGLGLLPIVPILLLPFIIIIFVIVFPLWLIAMGVVGLVYVIVAGANKLFLALNIRLFSTPARAVRVAFRWVLTFGGLARSPGEPSAEDAATRR